VGSSHGLTHRHLHVVCAPGTPLEELPLAALVDLLERGDLDTWRPIAEACAREPWGLFAKKVLRLADAYPMYGTSPLWRTFVDRCRTRSGTTPPASLAELRRRHGLTQVELAQRMQMSQSDLSKFERRHDVRLSTLKAYAEALGGRLRIQFEDKNERTEIKIPADR